MRRRGFTMIEILIVVGIVAVLAAMLIPAVSLIRARSLRVKNESLLMKVHAGLLEYRDTYVSFPQTGADPLVTNRLALYLCTPDATVSRADRSSSVLAGEIPASQIRGEAIVDYYAERPLVFISTLPGSPDPRDVTPLPAVPGSDATSMLDLAYEGYAQGFELWSAGPDRVIDGVRNADANDDNLSVTEPYGDLGVL